MPDCSSTAPALLTTWVAIDQHKLSLAAGILPASGGTPEVVRLENTERAVRRFVERLGGPDRLAVYYQAGRAAMSFTGCCRGSARRAM
jgi:hypothetical protein